MSKFLSNKQYPITIDATLAINEVESRPPSMIRRLEHILHDLCLDEEMSDCRIICEDQIFPCHKFILSVRSKVFKTMFQTEEMTEGWDATSKFSAKFSARSV